MMLQPDGLFFISDTHFFHNNILKYSKRTEFTSKPETDIILGKDEAAISGLEIGHESLMRMHEGMIARWNAVVQPEDTVYHLGDIFLGRSNEDALSLRYRLNGKIHLIRGNHDFVADQIPQAFESISDYKELMIDDPSHPKGQRPVILFHYALRVWHWSNGGSYSLYGHSHGDLPDDPNALSFDVGVDCWNYTPVSWEQVQIKMRSKSWRSPKERLKT